MSRINTPWTGNEGTGNEAGVHGNDQHTDADVEGEDFVHNYHFS